MLKKSPLFDFLNRHNETDYEGFIAESVEGEQYINWNQFALPHDYGDAEAEYSAIRNSCAIFDVSPLRKTRVRGADAGAFFDRLLTRPVSGLAPMRATYTVFCNEDGNVKDDAILYKFDQDDYLLMPSDVDHSPYFESLRQQIGLGDVSFTEFTESWVGAAIQGPHSAAVLQAMGFDQIEQLKPFQVRDYNVAGGTMRIARMGFTADLGYECWFEPGLIDAFIEMSMSLPGYGLSALQACRLEGGFVVAGWDFSTELDPIPGLERSPFELGLDWLVNLDAGDFVGRDALLSQRKNGSRFVLRSFEFDADCAPADGTDVYVSEDIDGVAAGIVSSSSWSWGMNKIIGNASIRSEHADLQNAWLMADGQPMKLTLSRGPLISLDRRNQVPAPLEIRPAR